MVGLYIYWGRPFPRGIQRPGHPEGGEQKGERWDILVTELRAQIITSGIVAVVCMIHKRNRVLFGPYITFGIMRKLLAIQKGRFYLNLYLPRAPQISNV